MQHCLRGLTKLTALAAVSFVVSTAATAQDRLTVGSVVANGSSVEVPVYVRDVAGTPLGVDKPAGSKIQSLSIKVDYAPAGAVQSVSFDRSGITSNLTPTVELKPSGAGTVSLLATFQESTNPIPFTLNATSPGNEVARLRFTLSASAAPGSQISLSLDGTLTQLTNQGGTTSETTANGALDLVDGSISIPSLTLSLSPGALNVPFGGSATIAARTSANVLANTIVTLVSSNPSVAAVPASVLIPAGQKSTSFSVAGLAVGTAMITATSGSAKATADVEVTDCPVPAAPALSAPSEALVGTAYTVSWPSVARSTEYEVDEATNPQFEGATKRTVTSTSVQYTHDSAGSRWYYRARARDKAGSCNTISASSPAISVLITSAPVSETSVLPVVGSLPGGFGAYFKTSLALYNPRSAVANGTLVFHPAGASGSASDPSLPFSVAPSQSLSFADLLPAMGVATGIGSLDVVSDPGTPLPVALARIFNDAGAAGTTGFATEPLPLAQALSAGMSGALLAPADPSKLRMNIGVRTLLEGATITITVRSGAGEVVKTVTVGYGPTFFVQLPSATLLDGYQLAGGESITFNVTSGSAFVYGSTTDTTTNDPSVQFARAIE